jgi:protein O-GlcNAc transferase
MIPKPPMPTASNGSNASELMQRALAFHKQGNLDQAARLYQTILGMDASHFDARHMLGTVTLQRGQLDEAILLISGALQSRPDSFHALRDAGFAFLLAHRLDEAVLHYSKALAIQSDDIDALFQRGNALAQLHRYDEALVDYDRAIALKSGFGDALANRGMVAFALNRVDEAIANLEQALMIRPDLVEALHNLGRALASQQRYDEAIGCFDGVLALHPNAYEALNDRGNAFRAMGRHEAAIVSYGAAILAGPEDPALYYNRGITQLALNLGDRAIEDFDKALAIKPDHVEALIGRGHACMDLKRYDDAAKSYLEAYSQDPNVPFLMGYLAHAQAQICDWSDYDGTVQRVVEGARAGRSVCVPFAFLVLSDDPAAQLLCATSCVRSQHSRVRLQVSNGTRRTHDRIRLGYLSANFHNHAAAYLIAELFELHDRSRFEVTGISFGPESRGATRSRLQASLDRFIDVRAMSDADVSTLLRDLEIDIAIDMMGHTLDARLDIFAYRPAPIQVNYLGYAGTTGTPFIDYIIVDNFVVPAGDDTHYSERVVRLPECLQVTDSTRPVAARTLSRAEVGLPERGFVFCCFNNTFKITPEMFDLWMRLICEVEGSVLWLLRSNASAERNLRREAEKRGVASNRLVFAPKVPMDQYQAQHRVADLFLDTLPYNAHTTAGYALWAGLPVLTCLGKSFAARVAGSQLNGLNLPDLVTGSIDEYEARALQLATNPALLQAIKQKLARAVVDASLFHTDRYLRHLEAAYTTMYEMYARGEAPRSFDVARLRD